MRLTALLHRIIIGKNDRIQEQPVLQQKAEPKTLSPKPPLQTQDPAAIIRDNASHPLAMDNQSQSAVKPASVSNLEDIIGQLNPSQKILLANFAKQLIQPKPDQELKEDSNQEKNSSQAALLTPDTAPVLSSAADSSSAAKNAEQAKAIQTSEFISSLAQATEEETYSRASVDFYKKQSAKEEIRIPDPDARLDRLRQLLAATIDSPRDLGRIIASNHF